MAHPQVNKGARCQQENWVQCESLPETPGCQGLPGAAAGKTQSVGLAQRAANTWVCLLFLTHRAAVTTWLDNTHSTALLPGT